MAKWDNMLAILWLLKSKRTMTASQIAEELEISVRTVYRYIDALCASGVPILSEAGHDGGYRLSHTFKEAPLFFHPDELKAIAHAALFAQGAGYPYEETLAHALNKMKSRLNKAQIRDLQRHTTGFDVISFPYSPFMKERLEILEKAVADKETLFIEYEKRNNESSERKIDPFGLAYRVNRWYVIAFCHLRRELRTFRADRIRKLSPSGMFFEKPADFSVAKFWQEQTDQNREAKGPLVTIRIQGDVEKIDYICGHWHLRHYLTERSDQEASFVLDEPTMNKYLPMFFLSFGKSIRVLEPARLIKRMAELARSLADYYESM